MHRYVRKPPSLARFPGQTDLRTTFWHESHQIWYRRGTAKKLQMPYSEETITDNLLLSLATRNPEEVIILPFNKRVEGNTGADWEWCFYDQRTLRYQRILVQAKLLDDKDRSYSHIDRFIGSTGTRQIEQLIKVSRNLQIPSLYLFYNNLTNVARLPSSRCACDRCTFCWGCSFALAEVVNDIRLNAAGSIDYKEFDVLSKYSLPLICLFCQSSAVFPSLVNYVKYAIENALIASIELLEENKIDPAGAYSAFEGFKDSESPSYVDLIQEIANSKDYGARSRIVEELSSRNPGVAGIALITERSPISESIEYF